MPKAAWCSQCGRFIWVAPDGSCPEGHGAECLTDVSGTGVGERGRRRERIGPVRVMVIVLALATVGFVVWAAFAALSSRSGAKSASLSSGSAGNATSGRTSPAASDSAGGGDSASASTKTVSARVITRRTSNPDIAAPTLDAFIARQYPGYDVARRISFPGQWEDERMSVNYLLRKKLTPAFELLVSVTQLGEDEELGELDWLAFRVGNVLTDDEVFSVDARSKYPFLSPQMRESIIAGYLARVPAAGSVAYGAYVDPQASPATVLFSVEAGKGAIDWAMQDFGGESRWRAKAVISPAAKTAQVRVDAQ